MLDERAPSRAELLDALRTSRDEVLAIVRALPPERLEEGRYESGWNGRQILAHIASIEWTYPRLFDIAREAPAVEAAAEGAPATRTMRGGNDAYNERQVAKRAHLTVADLLAEFERNRAATIRAVETVDDAWEAYDRAALRSDWAELSRERARWEDAESSSRRELASESDALPSATEL